MLKNPENSCIMGKILKEFTMDEKELILGQYQAYSLAKEKYIDRHFQTNRFYMVLSFILLFVCYLFISLTPAYVPVLLTAAFGMVVAALWWLNIDSYQFWIKIKYSRVLEYLETKLPERPFNKEFIEFREAKKRKKAMVFADFQKGLTALLFLCFLLTFSYYLIQFLAQPKGM